LPVEQPIGTFYMSVLPVETILNCTRIRQRKFDEKSDSYEGIQRKEVSPRIKEIKEYSSDPNATFPTPIIIAVDKDKSKGLKINESVFEFCDEDIIGEVIDGQHRLLGLKRSEYRVKFNIPIIFMFGLTDQEKAEVFSIINSTQRPVSKSLIYDLFELSSYRSPQKTCHVIAKLLNSDYNSPFYRRLKVLGRKESEMESLSQGSFIEYLLPLISKTPDKDLRCSKQDIPFDPDENVPLRSYFIDDKDEVIYKILFNLFTAVKNVFEKEWNNPDEYILSKTLGYGAILTAFEPLYSLGKKKGTLSINFFTEIFEKLKYELKNQNKELTSEHFSSNRQEQKELADIIIKCVKDFESNTF